MGKLDIIHGIDRYKDSPTYGGWVLRFANIWSTTSANKKIGEIQHGTVVEILEEKKEGNASWHKVKGRDNSGNMLSGWLRTSLLLYAGESEFKCHA